MNSRIKIILIVGVILFLCGAAAGVTGFMMGGAKDIFFWPEGLQIVDPGSGRLIWTRGPQVIDPDSEAQTEKVDETFENISGIELNMDNISSVTVREGPALTVKGQNHWIMGGLKAGRAEDGVLRVTNSVDVTIPKFILNFPDFLKAKAFEPSWIVITVPTGAALSAVTLDVEYGDVEIGNIAAGSMEVDSESGKVAVNDLTCDTLKVLSSYGDVDARNINAGDISFSSDSGDVDMTNLTASGRLTAKSSYGAVKLDGISAGAAEFHLSSGDFTADGVRVTDGIQLDSSYGAVKISGDLRGNSLIKASSGDIDVTTDGVEDDYLIMAGADFGEVSIGDVNFGGNAYFERGPQSAPNRIEARSDYGAVRVRVRNVPAN